MNVKRMIVGGVAIVAGLLAALLAGSRKPEPAPAPVQVVMPQVKQPPMAEVLVAAAPVPIGGTLNPNNVVWRNWPEEAIGANFVRRTSRPNALEDFKGAISRFPLTQGEPVMEARIIKGDRGGFMAAMLPQGMRAVAVPISVATGVGGFILPNDRVDVLLTRRERAAAGQQERFTSETILTAVRVMAIDQTIQERDGEKVVVGSTATLELSPNESETIALSRQMGEISLALRSLADSKERKTANDQENDNRRSSVTIVRFGVPAQAPMIGR